MKLTKEILHASGSNGYVGWNRQQMQLFGINWPPKKGWLSSLIDTEIEDEKWHKIMALSGVKNKNARKEIMSEQPNLNMKIEINTDEIRRGYDEAVSPFLKVVNSNLPMESQITETFALQVFYQGVKFGANKYHEKSKDK